MEKLLQDNLTNIFELKVDFERGSQRPSRVFKAMSGMIDAISELDKELVRSFGIEIETQLILEDIQVGSVRTKLCYMLNAIDDDALKEMEWKKAVGSFLVKGKQYLLKRLEEKREIPSIVEIREIEGDIIKLAEETDIKRFPIYSSIQSKRLLEGLSHLYSATSALAPGDVAYFISNEGADSIPQGLYIPSQAIEDVLTRETMRSVSNMILRVKKLAETRLTYYRNNGSATP